MNLNELCELLTTEADNALRIFLPNGEEIPLHFHVTEVGYVQKTFIDCGRTVRQLQSCLLQIWVEKDVEHRLKSKKLLGVLEKSLKIFPSSDLPVELEWESIAVSQYPLDFVANLGDSLILNLGTKHTDCLAKEVCLPGSGCCANPAECR